MIYKKIIFVFLIQINIELFVLNFVHKSLKFTQQVNAIKIYIKI